MRMSSPSLSPAIKERKTSQSASSKIDSIIKQLFLPMLNMPTPERTSFLPEDSEDQLLRQVAQEKPEALTSETEFVDYMVLLYRKFQKDKVLGNSIYPVEMDSSSPEVESSNGSDLLHPGAGESPL
jgi:hypothetical protein